MGLGQGSKSVLFLDATFRLSQSWYSHQSTHHLLIIHNFIEGVKRLRKEYEEFQHAGETDDIKTTIAVFPLEDNFFEWHFTMSGPEGSDYEGGLYHGKINFPTNYPFAPPDIMFLSVHLIIVWS